MDEDDEILDCPNCGREYDDADADFYICHHCGFNANTSDHNGKETLKDISANNG